MYPRLTSLEPLRPGPPRGPDVGSQAPARSGLSHSEEGLGILVHAVGRDMVARTTVYSAHRGFLIVGTQTELDRLLVQPNEISVLPRKNRHRVTLAPSGGLAARGYVCDLYDGHAFCSSRAGTANRQQRATMTRPRGRHGVSRPNSTITSFTARNRADGAVPFPPLPPPCQGTAATGSFQKDMFRPPWYHQNCMSEITGLAAGEDEGAW